MFKKLLILSLGVVLVLGLLFGRNWMQYLGNAVDDLRETVKAELDPELEIEGIRDDVNDLKSEIHDSMHKVAKEEVALDELREEIVGKGQVVSKLDSRVRELNRIAKSGETFVAFDGRQFSTEDVKTDLGFEFKRLKTESSTLEHLKQLFDRRQKTLNATRHKLDEMIAEKQQMEVEVANLESIHRLNEVAEMTSNLEIDDSPFNQANKRIKDLKTRLKTERKMLNVDTTAEVRIPLEAPQSQDITDQVDAFLNPQADGIAASTE